MKKLYRSTTDVKISGLCAGIADYFDMDPSIVRLLTLLAIIPGGLSIWVYIIASIVVPAEPAYGYKDPFENQ